MPLSSLHDDCSDLDDDDFGGMNDGDYVDITVGGDYVDIDRHLGCFMQRASSQTASLQESI